MDTCIILPLLRVWIMKPPQWTLLWNPAKSFDGFPPSGQVEGLPSSILDKFWQEKFLDPKNPGCESSILPGWKMGVGGKVGVGVLNGFCWMLGCCFFFLKPGSMILNDPIWWAVYIVLLVFQNATSREKHGRAVILEYFLDMSDAFVLELWNSEWSPI